MSRNPEIISSSNSPDIWQYWSQNVHNQDIPRTKLKETPKTKFK